MAIAGKHLRRQRIGSQAHFLADVLFDERVDARIGAHCTRNGARCGNLASLLQAGLGALEGPSPAAEFHAEHHGLSMNAMGTTHAQGVLEFKCTALAGFAELLHVGQNNVERLRDLVRQRGIAQVGRSHAIVHPTAGLFFAFGNIGIDVFSHVREERNNVVVRHGLNLGNTIDGEVRMVANPLCVFLGDAALPQLGLGLACEQLDFLPNVELVLKLPNGAHGRARVARNHTGPFRRIDQAIIRPMVQRGRKLAESR